MKSPKTLQHLLQHVLATQFAGVQAGLAEALELDQTHVGRLVRGVTTTLSTESCLRLARVCDIDPDEVFTLAGKAETAQTIRVLYGKAAGIRQALTAEERAWLDVFRGLAPDHRASLLGLAKAIPRPS